MGVPDKPSSRSRRVRQHGLAASSGVLYFLGFCGFDQWPLAWVCLVPVLWALDDDSLGAKGALAIAWTFGFVAHLGAYTWLVGMLRDFGHLPVPLALTAYALLCFAQSFLLAAFGFATHWLTRHRNVSLTWAVPVTMVVAEATVPALFPSYLANSQYRQTAFIQSADVWGLLGLSFLLASASSVVYAWLRSGVRKRGPKPLLASALLVAALVGNHLYGRFAIARTTAQEAAAPRRVSVGVVQTNMGIYEKHENPGEGLRRHQQQSLELEQQGAKLIVWPESGFNYIIPHGTTNLARQVLGPLTTPLIFGGLRADRDANGKRRVFNTAFLIDGGGEVLGTYDKTYLLAFGEALPLGDVFPFLYDLSPHTGRFTRGSHVKPLVLDGVRYGVLICYEDILPRFVQDVMDEAPHVLVNLTNDAWFGVSREPVIHLALSVFRSIEHRRWLVRSTNTGVSAFVDPLGRIHEATPIFARANAATEVTPLDGRTIYARFGDWVAWVSGLVMLTWVVGPRLSQRLRARRSSPARS